MDFDAAVAQLDTLVETLEREGDERALMLLQLVDAIHRPALARIAAGELDDPMAQALLAMYGLAEVEPEILVDEALDEVRPYIESHGGDVELLDVRGGEVHLRLGGACNGCAGSAMTLTRGIEQALREHYPPFERIVAHEPEPALLQIQVLHRPVFAEVASLSALPPGEIEVADADGTAVLLANVDGDVFALLDGCAVDGRSLAGGRLTGPVVVCPWHNCAYDVRSGKSADEGPDQLRVVPVAVDGDAVKVAVNVA